jgi:hypothetical protein
VKVVTQVVIDSEVLSTDGAFELDGEDLCIEGVIIGIRENAMVELDIRREDGQIKTLFLTREQAEQIHNRLAEDRA